MGGRKPLRRNDGDIETPEVKKPRAHQSESRPGKKCAGELAVADSVDKVRDSDHQAHHGQHEEDERGRDMTKE